MMTLSEFESQVDPQILRRGRTYFENGYVRSLEQVTDGLWLAQVEGTTDYEVKLRVAPDGELGWACSCPYDSGPICKHVVAVMYALEDAGWDGNPSDPPAHLKTRADEDQELRQVLEARSRQDLIDILLAIAGDDEQVAFDLIAAYGHEPKDRQGYLRMAHESLHHGEDRHGFLNYWGAPRAASGLDSLLERGNRLLEAGDAEQAVHVAQAVFEAAVDAIERADDSMGRLGDCVDYSLDLLTRAASDLPPRGRRELFDYCLTLAPESPYCDWDWGFELALLAATLIERKGDRDRVFAVLDEMSGEDADHEFDGGSWWNKFDAERAALIKLSVIRRLDGEKSGLKFLQEHLHFDAFRKRLIDHHIERHEWPRVKALCWERLEEGDAVPPGLRKDYLDTLLKVAQQEDQLDVIVRLAHALFLEFRDFDYYELLKAAVPAKEWKPIVERLLEETAQRGFWTHIQAEILAREERWDRLLTLALSSGEHLVKTYREELEVRYPGQICEAYERFVYEMLERTSGRPTYAKAADYLRRMHWLGKGDHPDEMVEELCTTYRNRPAMIDELRNYR